MLTKQLIRKNISKKRKTLDSNTINTCKKNALDKIKHHYMFDKSKNIALYWPKDNEVDPTLLINIDSTKKFYLPIIQKNKTLIFGEVSKMTNLVPNKYNILEPEGTDLVTANSLDLIILPSIAIDINKNRIGSGGGYYDRTFELKKNLKSPYIIALIYKFQHIKSIPTEKHDIKCDDVIIV
jgi:5-formyltetrahydrofolate cyclo-ligase